MERLQQYENATLPFMYDLTLPFDNILAEPDTLMMRIQQKIAVAYRSFESAFSLCRIGSYTLTVKKQGFNVIYTFQEVFSEKQLLPQIQVWLEPVE